jgi:hypothetical protein
MDLSQHSGNIPSSWQKQDMRYSRNKSMEIFEIFHICPHKKPQFTTIVNWGLKTLKQLSIEWVEDLSRMIQSKCIYWLDPEIQVFRVNRIYFSPERPPQTCNFVSLMVPGDTLVLDNWLEQKSAREYFGSAIPLSQHIRNPKITLWEIALGGPIIKNFKTINYAHG